MNIHVDQNIPSGQCVFKPHGSVALFNGRHLSREELSNTDALIIRSVTKVDKSLLEGTPVRFVGTTTIGTDHVDQAYLKRAGIGFAFAPGCNSNSVGEYIISVLLNLSEIHGWDLTSKTLGIVGYGNVGRNVVGKASALGMRILVNDPPLKRSGNNKTDFQSIDDIKKEADIISLHVPLVVDGSFKTFEMVNRSFLKNLRRIPYLINTCRGEVFEQTSVMEAFDKKWISGMALDVFPNEPRIDVPFCNKCDIISPHIAGYSHEGKLNGLKMIHQAFCMYFNHQNKWKSDLGTPKQLVSHGDLKKIVDQAYNVMEDHEQLKKALLADDIPYSFDQLRKYYRKRREFPNHIVDGTDQQINGQLGALGFQVLMEK